MSTTSNNTIDTINTGTFLATVDHTFDPMGDVFVAQSEKPAHVRDINLRTLTPFQRALLVIDGTVTKFIESYTMEPVEIVRLSQEKRQLSADHLWLKASKNTPVLARRVLIKAKYSHKLHVYAMSLIVPSRLANNEREGLELDDEGLGRILLKGQIETRREVLWYGKEYIEDLPEAIRGQVDGEFFSRTYRIITQGQPVMLINEKFPRNNDHLPSSY